MHEETRATRSATTSAWSFSVVLRAIPSLHLDLHVVRLRRKQGLQIMTATAGKAISLLDDEAGHARTFEQRQHLQPALVRRRSALLDHLGHLIVTCVEQSAR